MMMLSMMLVDIVMPMVRLLIFRHVHIAVALVVLSPVHEAVLSLIAILRIHVVVVVYRRS